MSAVTACCPCGRFSWRELWWRYSIPVCLMTISCWMTFNPPWSTTLQQWWAVHWEWLSSFWPMLPHQSVSGGREHVNIVMCMTTNICSQICWKEFELVLMSALLFPLSLSCSQQTQQAVATRPLPSVPHSLILCQVWLCPHRVLSPQDLRGR